jgi:hypothetical protein
MKPRKKPHARELEIAAAREPALPIPPAPSRTLLNRAPLAMLLRRGITPVQAALDLPFDPEMPEEWADRLAERLDHYAFRLFLRGAILRPEGFRPDETTRFIGVRKADECADQLVELGLAEPLAEGRYRLTKPAASFGGTLEWLVARQLRTVLALDAVAGVQLKDSTTGGDLDVVAVAEDKLIVLELKSSPPKHLTEEEVGAFLDRLEMIRPHISIFALDTSLRLSDKVIPMLVESIRRRRPGRNLSTEPMEREIYALTPHLYVINARTSLIGNIARAIAEGLRALGPEVF